MFAIFQRNGGRRLGGIVVVIGRIIESDACVAEGAAFLAELDSRFQHALQLTGTLPLRRRPDGFAQLFSAIISQQVSTASAAAIWARIEAAGLAQPDAILRASDDDLKAVGMSRPKIKYARALAEADIDYTALRTAPDQDVIQTLVAVPGIGPWTAEIYAMFSLGRADVFAPGDLALQEATRLLFELPERPSAAALRQLSEAWSPWRAVAARLLFAYYRVAKNREGIR